MAGGVIAPDGVRVPRPNLTPELRVSLSKHKDVLKLLYKLRIGCMAE